MLYYFTYGTEGQPYVGGWTEIEADDEESACRIFRKHHPDQHGGLLNCAGVYDQSTFAKTDMYRQGANLCAGCHESIPLAADEREDIK